MIGIVELDGNVLVLRARSRKNIQAFEGSQGDLIDVGATAWDDEVLDGSEGKAEVASSQKGQFTGDLALACTEPSLLFTFLPNDGGNLASQIDITPEGKALHHILQGTQDDIGESHGESDGRFEVRNGESVRAGLDLIHLEVFQRIVGAESMKFLLLQDENCQSMRNLDVNMGDTHSKNSLQGIQDLDMIFLLVDVISLHLVGDVGDEFIEECNFEELIECNQLEIHNALAADHWWRRTIWQGTMGSLLDQLHLLWAWGRHSIRQLILPKWSWSGCSEQCQARKSNGNV